MAVKSKADKVRQPIKKKTTCEQNRLLPKSWSTWAAEQSVNFDVGVDEKMRFEGQPAACIEAVDAAANSFIWLYQTMDSSGYRGKRVRWTGYIKTKGVTDKAVFWLDVLASNNCRLAMDNMADRPIKASKSRLTSSTWAEYC